LAANNAATREEKEGIMAEECSHECSSCGVSGCGDRTAEAGPSTLAPNNRTNVKHVIGVVSGKGGVGKSLVTSLLASEMNKRGHKVAILDADITGPSIPKSFGVDSRLTADADGINPAKSASGIEVMSVNLMLPEGDMPVAWRGPVVTGAIKQFWQEVNWGDVDYMFVDMPPGTSDVFLTVFQSLPVDGIVTVSAPQELVAMIVGKAVNLAHDMDVEVLGLVENMAYFKCDDCGKEHHIFGEPQGAEVAERYNIPAYTTLPIDPKFARLCDEGKVEDYDVEGKLDVIIDKIVEAGEKQEEKAAE
jgi:Mrp family chromosome partitioning ATPase